MTEEVIKQDLPQEDEYAKIETEKALRSRKKRKIWTTVVLACAVALAVVVIILSTVPVNLRPVCMGADFSTIEFFGSGSSSGEGKIDKNDDTMNANYDKFVKAFKESFAEPYIAAIFGGTLAKYDIAENHEDFNKAKNLIGNSKYVALKYDSKRAVTYRNGKVYEPRYVTSGELIFDTVYVTINNQNGFVETNLYFKVDYPNGGTKNKLIVVTLKANTSKIADLWEEFVD